MDTPGQKLPLFQIIKCIIIGDVAVGKTCLLLQFTDHKFRQHHDATISFEASTCKINIDGKLTKLHLFDSAGQETFRSLTKACYRGAAAAILVYDITRRETFDHIGSWLKDAKEFGLDNLTVILVGNKCDLSQQRAVSYEEGEGFAKEHGLIFMESSAKTNQNVEEAFFTAARSVSQKIEDGVIDISAKFGGLKFSLRDESHEEGRGGCCCS